MTNDGVIANSTLVNLVPTAAKTATGQGSGVEMTAYEGNVAVVLDSAAGTGTTPTLDAKLQHCDTSGGTYTDIPDAIFSTVTDAAARQKISVDIDKVKKYMRAAYTIGGTTPSFTLSVNVLAVKKYIT